MAALQSQARVVPVLRAAVSKTYLFTLAVLALIEAACDSKNNELEVLYSVGYLLRVRAVCAG